MPFFKTSAGLNIYYEEHGNSGEPLLLLHGLASSTRIWEPQYPLLSQHFRVYALDFPGHGQSDPTDTYSMTLLAEILREFITHLGVRKVHLVALSLGCSVALTFAAQYPTWVSKMILEGPVAGGGVPIYHPYFWFDFFLFKVLPFLLLGSLALFGYQPTIHFIDTYGMKNRQHLHLLEMVQKEADQKAIRQLLLESAAPPYLGKLRHFRAPLLMIRGKEDPMPMRFCNYIEQQVRGEVHLTLVPEVRHIVALEKPEEFNRLVLQFLACPNESRL